MKIGRVSFVGFTEQYLCLSNSDQVSRVNAAVIFLPAPPSYTRGPQISCFWFQRVIMKSGDHEFMMKRIEKVASLVSLSGICA